MGEEQAYNAKMLEKVGVSVRVANGAECRVRHDDIVEKINIT
jgi:hypothetical protein